MGAERERHTWCFRIWLLKEGKRVTDETRNTAKSHVRVTTLSTLVACRFRTKNEFTIESEILTIEATRKIITKL